MTDSAPRLTRTLSLLTAAVFALQAAGGFFIPLLYLDNAWVSSVFRGTDFVALVFVLPLLLVSHALAERGSVRAKLVRLGVLSKIFYNNLYLLFGADFNRFFLVYVAVFICSSFAIVAALAEAHADGVGAAPPSPSVRQAAAVIMVVEAGILAVIWTGQSLAYVATGQVPQLVTDGGGGTHLVAALDLTTIVPPLVLGAWWLWRSRPWGSIVSAVMLVACAIITVDLVTTPAFQAAAGVAGAWTMAPLFGAMGVGFLAGAVLLLRGMPGGRVNGGPTR